MWKEIDQQAAEIPSYSIFTFENFYSYFTTELLFHGNKCNFIHHSYLLEGFYAF